MMNISERFGEWALVAGAAEGIGRGFSLFLSKQGLNLVMVDIHEKSLMSLSAELKKTYGVKTIPVLLDLARENADRLCMEAIHSLDCRLMVYIPAYSKVCSFLSFSREDLDLFINLNSRTPMRLIHSFASGQASKDQRGIILISSLAGMIGPQYVAPYAGTRAFNMVLAEALFHEFKEKNIDILACCAGITSTPTYWASRPEKGKSTPGIMEPEEVAVCALKNIGKKSICIPGWKNRLSYFFLTRILSRKQASALVSKAMGKMYPELR